MDTAEIALLFFYVVILAMAATVAALTFVYIRRLPSSKATRNLKREGGQGEESALEEKAESRPVPESSSGRGIHKQAISSGNKPLEPEAAASEVHTETQETGLAASSEGMKQWFRMKGITSVTRNKADKQKQAYQREPVALVESSELTVALQDDSVRHTPLAGAPQGQIVMTELKSGEGPAHEPSPGNTRPAGERGEPAGIAELAQIIKEGEDSMDNIHNTEVNQASSEPPAATADSDKANHDMPQTQKFSMGDLSDLFAKTNVEDTRANKLAEEMNDVDINELLQEGLGLLGKLKKFDR